MDIKIQNFRGIDDAALTIEPMVLVCGTNMAGKSSIAQAVALAITGTVVPDGLVKSNAGMLVRAGTGGASITITHEAQSMTVTWPQGKVKTTGDKPPSSSPFAAGIQSIVDMKPVEVASTMIERLKALPNFKALSDALEPIGVPVDQITLLWQMVTDHTWDNALAQVKESGIKFKGRWEHITGERYGSAKGGIWQPADWASDLAGASEAALQAQVTEQREFLDGQIATSAISASERERLQNLAALVPSRVDAKNAAANAVKAARILKIRADDELAAMPPPGAAEHGVACPHCGAEVVIAGRALRAPKPAPTAEEAAAINAKRQPFLEHARDSTAGLEAAEEVERTTTAALREAQQAAERLRTLGQDDGDEEDPESINRARTALATAEKRLAAFKAKTEADRLHRNIGVNAQIQEVLDPRGLRTTHLKAALGKFNATLEALCKAGEWGTVEIGEDMAITYARRPWILLSESERFRTRATLQVAMAEADGSDLLIIDAADILDRTGRNGLFSMLKAAGKRSLITMTMNKAADVPDLSKAGLGTSYWIEGARLQPLNQPSA